MSDKLSIDPKITALLVMDFQTGIVDGYATEKEALLDRTTGLLAAARARELTIVYVVVGFRAGYPEISFRNMSFTAIRSTGRFIDRDSRSEIHPALAVKPGEIIVTKHRVSAFAGTDLDMILRAKGIETLILAGIATSGVVLSTVRHASDADYRLVVVSDCCSDRDGEVHAVLMEKVFPRQATVATAHQVMKTLDTKAGSASN